MRLTEALAGVELAMAPEGPGGTWKAYPVTDGLDAAAAAVIDVYGLILATWWRTSPSCVLECVQCGEVALVGKRPAKPGRRCWRCKATGAMQPIEPPFIKPRPRAKTKKMEA